MSLPRRPRDPTPTVAKRMAIGDYAGRISTFDAVPVTGRHSLSRGRRKATHTSND